MGGSGATDEQIDRYLENQSRCYDAIESLRMQMPLKDGEPWNVLHFTLHPDGRSALDVRWDQQRHDKETAPIIMDPEEAEALEAHYARMDAPQRIEPDHAFPTEDLVWYRVNDADISVREMLDYMVNHESVLSMSDVERFDLDHSAWQSIKSEIDGAVTQGKVVRMKIDGRYDERRDRVVDLRAYLNMDGEERIRAIPD